MAVENRREFYSGQGRVYFARKNELGRPDDNGLIYVGVCNELITEAKVDVKKKQESETGKNAVIARFETAQEVAIQAKLCEIREENLNLFLYGTSQRLATATVTEEAIKAKLGREVPLSRMVENFTSLTSDDGTTTYAEGTDYIVRPTGLIVFPSNGSAIADGEALKANFKAKPERITTAFTEDNFYSYWRVDGLNRGSDNKPVVMEMYKARFDPTKLDIINDDFADYDLSGDLHYDDCFADDSLYGGFMRIRVVE